MNYEWSPDKATANLKKHGIVFADAVGVFEDEHAITIEDKDAEGEQVFITIGLDFLLRNLVVIYTYRRLDTIRIISARKATRKERKTYEEGI